MTLTKLFLKLYTMENKLNRKKIKHTREDTEMGTESCQDVVKEASQKDERW